MRLFPPQIIPPPRPFSRLSPLSQPLGQLLLLNASPPNPPVAGQKGQALPQRGRLKLKDAPG